MDYFPASGLRLVDLGKLEYIGAIRCWTSSSYGVTRVSDRAGCIVSQLDSTSPLSFGSRAEGFPVRCVQELIK